MYSQSITVGNVSAGFLKDYAEKQGYPDFVEKWGGVDLRTLYALDIDPAHLAIPIPIVMGQGSKQHKGLMLDFVPVMANIFKGVSFTQSGIVLLRCANLLTDVITWADGRGTGEIPFSKESIPNLPYHVQPAVATFYSLGRSCYDLREVVTLTRALKMALPQTDAANKQLRAVFTDYIRVVSED